ncbi:AAA family ATPase [Comamonas granuli]|uniref:AAA family ATPase n=1 Tax=Comamonas granuli TaxID=290309 RepID=UPI000693FD38|nr:AAA family ATPase [Comamonas granuli]
MSSLYLEHFRLGEAPFGITPNGKFFFEGQARGAILDALHHAVLDEDGIVVVVGEVGSGKTMLCRMLAERLPRAQVDLVYLANPSFGPREILLSLIADWGLQPPAEGQPLVLTIQQALLQRHAQGRRAVVLIDEAQAMPPESLEEIKLLSNLETAQHKLLQIVLFGQPELDALLALPKLRQVRDRVVHRFELQPLNGPEAAAYIEHRLRRAGWQGGALFEPRALHALTEASGGRIRAIHLLADKALLAAFAQGARQVGRAHVRMAVAEVQGGGAALRKAPAPAARWRRPVQWLALAAVAGLGAGVAVGYGLGQRSAPAAMAAAPQALDGAPAPVPGPGAEPAASAPHGAAEAALPAAAPAPPPEETEAERPVAAAPPMPPQDATGQRYAALPAALREAVLRTRAVFDDPAQEFWVLQIGLADSAAGALRLLEQARQPGTEVWVQDRIYPGSRAPAAPVWAVYVGRHASRAQAVQNLQEWPASRKTHKPLPRSLGRLRAETYPERAPS